MSAVGTGIGPKHGFDDSGRRSLRFNHETHEKHEMKARTTRS